MSADAPAPPSRLYPQRPIVGVGAVVVMDGRVVLVRRKHEPLAGSWSLPGGGVELGETLAACIKREVAEETGLDVVVGPVIEVLDRIHRDADGRIAYHYVLVDYACDVEGGVLEAGTDASNVALVSEDDLDRYDVAPATRDIIQRGLAAWRAWT